MKRLQTPHRGGDKLFLYDLHTSAGVTSSRYSGEILKYGLTGKSFYSSISVTTAEEHFNEL